MGAFVFFIWNIGLFGKHSMHAQWHAYSIVSFYFFFAWYSDIPFGILVFSSLKSYNKIIHVLEKYLKRSRTKKSTKRQNLHDLKKSSVLILT